MFAIQHRCIRGAFLCTVSMAALVAATSATAQQQSAAADADAPTQLEEIIVTAQKAETNLQKTPISISVLNADDLVNRHAQSLQDLGDGSIPSLRIAPFFARSSALTIGMRGIGALGDANQPARDQAVGVYIDGVYLGRAQGLGSALYDVERIEVLKGPQGTLFGRNTEGGAISIVTKAPSGKFGSRTTLGFSNFNGYQAVTHLDLPTVNNIDLKFDGLLSKRDGTIKNITTSGQPESGQPDYNSYDKRGFNGQARLHVGDNFTADYSFDIAYDGTTPYYVQLLSKGSLALAPLIQTQPTRAKAGNIGVPLQLSVGKTNGHRVTLDWAAAEDWQVKSISSYRKLNQGQFDNAAQVLSAFAPNGLFTRYSIARVFQDQYSEELQVLGTLDTVKFVGGGFYYREKGRDNAQTPNSLQWNATGTAYSVLTLDLNTVPLDRASHVTTKSYGVFSQATWTPDIMDSSAHFTVGGRYTKDEKNGTLDTVNGNLPSYVDANRNVIVGVIPLNASWSHFNPAVIAAFDVTPDINVYGKWSTGFKAGGANSRSLTYRAFDPETVSMFEAGAKTEFLDKHARLNLAAYTGQLKKVQVDFSVIILNNTRGTLETTNAATGRTKGFEADLAVVPFPGMTLSASYVYNKVTLSQAFNPFTNAQAKIFPLYTPRNAGSIAADYEYPLSGATLGFHIDGNFADGHYTSSTDPNLSDKPVVFNGRLSLSDIGLSDAGAKMQLALWSRNLFNEQHVFLRNFNAALGTYAIFNEPRTFGLDATIKF